MMMHMATVPSRCCIISILLTSNLFIPPIVGRHLGGFRLGGHASDVAMVNIWHLQVDVLGHEVGIYSGLGDTAKHSPAGRSHSYSLQQFWGLGIFANALVFYSCLNKSPQWTKEHKTTKIYCLAVLEAEGLKPRCAAVNIHGQELFGLNVLDSDFLW